MKKPKNRLSKKALEARYLLNKNSVICKIIRNKYINGYEFVLDHMIFETEIITLQKIAKLFKCRYYIIRSTITSNLIFVIKKF